MKYFNKRFFTLIGILSCLFVVQGCLEPKPLEIGEKVILEFDGPVHVSWETISNGQTQYHEINVDKEQDLVLNNNFRWPRIGLDCSEEAKERMNPCPANPNGQGFDCGADAEGVSELDLFVEKCEDKFSEQAIAYFRQLDDGAIEMFVNPPEEYAVGGVPFFDSNQQDLYKNNALIMVEGQGSEGVDKEIPFLFTGGKLLGVKTVRHEEICEDLDTGEKKSNLDDLSATIVCPRISNKVRYKTGRQFETDYPVAELADLLKDPKKYPIVMADVGSHAPLHIVIRIKNAGEATDANQTLPDGDATSGCQLGLASGPLSAGNGLGLITMAMTLIPLALRLRKAKKK